MPSARPPGAGAPSASSKASGQEDLVIEAWNAMATRAGLPRSLGSQKVRRIIRTRVKAAGWLEAFRAALRHVEASPFHRGDNARGWRADLEHVLQDGRAEQLAAAAGAAPGSIGPPGQGRDGRLFVGMSEDGYAVIRSDLGDRSTWPVPWAPWEPEFNDSDSWRDLEAFMARDGEKATSLLVAHGRRNQLRAKQAGPNPKAMAPVDQDWSAKPW
jgi:hypothetical protein